MMRPSAPLAFVVAAVLSTFTFGAAADVVVPGYVETCTMANHAKPGLECHACAAYYGNHTHCPDSLASYGFTMACRSGGASVWSEIWCRPASATAAKVPPNVLGQLSNSSSRLKPAATASAAASTDSPPAAPAPTPAAPSAPTATPTAAPAPADPAPPAPPPTPPPHGCACTAGGDGAGPLAASLVAAVAAAVLAVRRRRPQ